MPLEQRPVLERARDIYVGAAAERWDDLRDRVPPFVELMVARIKEAAG